MEEIEIINSPIFKKIVEKMRKTDNYRKIITFKKTPADKAAIIYKEFSNAFIEVLLNEPNINFTMWPSMIEYLKTVFKIENVEMKHFPKTIETTNERGRAKNFTEAQMKRMIQDAQNREEGIPSDSRGLERDDEKEHAPLEKEKNTDNKRYNHQAELPTDPAIENLSKDAHKKRLEDEYLASLNSRMLR